MTPTSYLSVVGDGAPHEPHRGRLLGDVIVQLGYCDRTSVEAAVDHARATGRKMGEILHERQLVSPRQLATAIATRYGLRYISLDQVEPDVAALQLLPPAAVRRMDAVPIAFGAYDSIVVAIADPRDLLALDDLMFITDRQVEQVIVTRDDLDELLSRVGRLDAGLVDDSPEPEAPVVEQPELAESADDGHTVKLVRSIIADAIQQGASDIHFDPRDGGLNVRYRIDGILHQAARVPARESARIISRIKILSSLDISERRAPQDGRTSLTVGNRRVDIRVAIMPLIAGEGAVIRLLDPGDKPLSLGELGMGPEDLRRTEAALGHPHGTILATGPTGSGKSTSLYASLSMVSSDEKSVMTIEDPVEYRVPDIKQMQVHPRAGVTFASGLRAIVRADPDVILVGEIRDRESAKITIEASLTGHQVLSSLHTNTAATAPARLIEMGVEPYLVASALDCVIAQRLVRRLCVACREPVTVPAGDVGLPGIGEVAIFAAKGCDRCRGTGYRGRIGLFEVMAISEPIRQLISARATAGEIDALAVSEGMGTLREDGLAKVRAGHTSLREIKRVLG